jgi:hypothetical protein
VLRICSRIDEHFDGITAFLFDKEIAADNYGSERDIRCMAVLSPLGGRAPPSVFAAN